MGLFGLTKKVATFGLDIGSSAIKVVELVPGKAGHVLKSFGVVDLPREAISEGSIRQPAVVTDAIRECVQKAGVTSRPPSSRCRGATPSSSESRYRR
jgi:type IV pilus assembly protein PilM